MSMEDVMLAIGVRQRYSFASTGLKRNHSRYFDSKADAKEYMFKLCRKHNLNIEEVWEDCDAKTYITNNNVRFYIHKLAY